LRSGSRLGERMAALAPRLLRSPGKGRQTGLARSDPLPHVRLRQVAGAASLFRAWFRGCPPTARVPGPLALLAFSRRLLVAEVALSAIREVEDDLSRLVVGEVGGPALLVRRQPALIALGAVRNDRDAPSAHEPESRQWDSQRRRADCPLGYGRLAGALRSPNVRETRLKGRAASRTPRKLPKLPLVHAPPPACRARRAWRKALRAVSTGAVGLRGARGRSPR
jgi:hypothetical protein